MFILRKLPVVLFLCASSAQADPAIDALRAEVASLAAQLQAVQQRLAQLSASTEPAPVAQPAPPVSLALEEETSVAEPEARHTLSNPWWENVQIGGFAATGLYDTGDAGTRPDPTFEVKEASLFVEAYAWEDVSFFIELQTNRLGKDSQLFTRTGETYLHFRDIDLTDDVSFGLKIGRFDIPFGEEYLKQDAIDNPLITSSAAYPYGWDEGLLLYGSVGPVAWIAAVADGTDERSREDDSEKAWNLKLYGTPTQSSYLSLSLMKNGDSAESGIEFGGSHIQPVGSEHTSTLGNSASSVVDAVLGELDGRYTFELPNSMNAHLGLAVGLASVADADSVFDRDLRWLSIEPLLELTREWYLAARYSEIGTYDSDEGYHFDGKIYAGGNAAFGYDTERFRRLGLGLGWTPNPNVRAKLEIGRDWFDLIDASALDPNNSERHFAGFEVAAQF
jgi:hypothetical protein